MSGSVELILALEAAAASEWMAAPVASEAIGGGAGSAVKRASRRARSARAQPPADIGAAVADALCRMPDVAEVDPAHDATLRAFVGSAGNWRATHSLARDGAQQITALRTSVLSPGVRRCETVCDESLERNVSPAATGTLPPALDEFLRGCEPSMPSLALAARRGAWRWTTADGALVDIELHDVRGLLSDIRDATPAVSGKRGARGKPAKGEILEGPARQESASAPPIAFCELRLAVGIDAALAERDGTAAALQALFAAANALADVLPVFPALTDGYTRACTHRRTGGPVRAAGIDLAAAANPHDALIEAGSDIALQWIGNETGVRAGAAPEFVHQMRVALRRLKTLLKTFPAWIDETWARTIAPDLDWLGSLLGQLRDLDVFVDSTLSALAGADADTHAASWSSLQAHAAARRDRARADVAAALRTRRYARLSLAWVRWLAMQRVSSGPSRLANEPLADYAAKRVRKHYRRLVEKPDLASLTAAERHRRRIEAKRLRYTLEFFESLASRKTRRQVLKQLARIQSVLGDGSDAAAALRFLEALDAPPYQRGLARGWCEAVNRWSAIEGERLLQALPRPKIVRER